ncbi:LacI family DNA-binding transcriptional regulator [Paenibacillus sp. BR2-3]|uniref:LacI family DNA-binding transcriptional regulator n=1 Tax=Paenibacillus sp. BR2-3 TaxID=3048494 RepID=UPI00397735A4
MKKDINIIEVAKKAGVSIATVSRVFNNSGVVKESTRKKIQQIIEETGYHPNMLARELADKKTSLIGMIVHDMTGEGMPRAINGVNNVLEELGYNLLIACTNGNFENERKQFDIFRSKRVEGIIFATATFTQQHAELIKNLTIPVISLLQDTEKDQIPFVSFDNYHFGKEAAIKLIDLGHTNIGFISGPEGSANAEQRLKGYKDGLTEAGIQLNPDSIINGNFHIEDGYNKMKILLDRNINLTSVITVNDGMGIGAINCLLDMGIKVPEQFSVLALDDTVLAKASRLKLSGVQYSYTELGQEGAKILLHMVENNQVKFEKYMVPYTIHIRESVAIAKS